MINTTSITLREYGALDGAYHFFNERLFAGWLPLCLITLHRHPKARGFFCPDKFEHREQGERTAEIALNPDTFQGRTDLEILSTLVHEMVHLWQHYRGRPSRSGYHNKEWADKMEEVGLVPSSTGAPGGERVGQKISHYIEFGRFSLAAKELIDSGFKLSWQSPHGQGGSAQKTTRAKFTCPCCQQNAWARPSAYLICGDCLQRMVTENAPAGAGGDVEPNYPQPLLIESSQPLLVAPYQLATAGDDDDDDFFD